MCLEGVCYASGRCMLYAEVEKVWQPGNLVARRILKNEALAESFWINLLHFLTSKQFSESVKEIILVFFKLQSSSFYKAESD